MSCYRTSLKSELSKLNIPSDYLIRYSPKVFANDLKELISSFLSNFINSCNCTIKQTSFILDELNIAFCDFFELEKFNFIILDPKSLDFIFKLQDFFLKKYNIELIIF